MSFWNRFNTRHCWQASLPNATRFVFRFHFLGWLSPAPLLLFSFFFFSHFPPRHPSLFFLQTPSSVFSQTSWGLFQHARLINSQPLTSKLTIFAFLHKPFQNFPLSYFPTPLLLSLFAGLCCEIHSLSLSSRAQLFDSDALFEANSCLLFCPEPENWLESRFGSKWSEGREGRSRRKYFGRCLQGEWSKQQAGGLSQPLGRWRKSYDPDFPKNLRQRSAFYSLSI